MNNKKRIIEFICIVAIIMPPISAEIITYRSAVDQDYGFYRVIDITTHESSPYVNNTLTINVGDIIEWINYADPDEPLTIVSKEELWGNKSAYLRWNYQKFSYTFNKSGSYEVYIKEYPREQHQIIKVNPTEVITVISTPTINITENVVSPTPIVTDKVPIKDTGNISIIWLLTIIVGIVIFIIYKNKKK